MKNYFECKIRYKKIGDNGLSKKVTELYLFDALSFSEAEARAIEEMTPFITGEFTVSDIKRSNYNEIFVSEEESADRWFKCKLVFVTLEEKSGAEKKTSTYVLVQAADLRDAVKKLDEGMKGTISDYQIGSISETAIMNVYPYEEKKEESDDKTPIKVRNFIRNLPDGQKTVVEISGKKVVIEKASQDTRVSPQFEPDGKGK